MARHLLTGSTAHTRMMLKRLRLRVRGDTNFGELEPVQQITAQAGPTAWPASSG